MIFRNLKMIQLVFLLLILSKGIHSAPEYFIYVVVNGPQINVYTQNPTTGELVFKSTQSIAGPSISMTSDREQKHLYVGLRGGQINAIEAYSIDQTTGLLNYINKLDIPQGPVHMSLDKTEKFIFTAPYGITQATINSIGSNGGMEVPLTIVDTDEKPHAALVDHTNKFLYITNLGSDNIHNYSFNESTGSIQPLSPFKTSTPANSGPRLGILHGTKNILYTYAIRCQ